MVGNKQLVIFIVVVVVNRNIIFGVGSNCRIKFFKIFYFIEYITEFKRSEDIYLKVQIVGICRVY